MCTLSIYDSMPFSQIESTHIKIISRQGQCLATYKVSQGCILFPLSFKIEEQIGTAKSLNPSRKLFH
uniref:Uncharacterized protein n=1 Tax=Arundo donax TaxID=35708 RepID=A0A0A9EW76_ARUDO